VGTAGRPEAADHSEAVVKELAPVEARRLHRELTVLRASAEPACAAPAAAPQREGALRLPRRAEHELATGAGVPPDRRATQLGAKDSQICGRPAKCAPKGCPPMAPRQMHVKSSMEKAPDPSNLLVSGSAQALCRSTQNPSSVRSRPTGGTPSGLPYRPSTCGNSLCTHSRRVRGCPALTGQVRMATPNTRPNSTLVSPVGFQKSA
jgi:hypothetical protein